MSRSPVLFLSSLPLLVGPLGFQEMLVIMLLALMLFGPRKLPKIGKTLGKSLAEFRRTSNELKSTLEREVQMEEFRAARADMKGFGTDLREGLAGATHPAPETASEPGSGGDPEPGTRSEEDAAESAAAPAPVAGPSGDTAGAFAGSDAPETVSGDAAPNGDAGDRAGGDSPPASRPD